MGVTPPGWYEDEHDAALARWWDGDRWTDHTLVIADQVPNVQPPPPPGYSRAGSEAFLDEEPDGDWARLEDDPGFGDDPVATVFAPIPDPEPAATSVFSLEDEPPVFSGQWDVQEEVHHGPAGLGDRYRDLPPWLQVGLPIAALLVLVLAVAAAGAMGGDGDDGGDAGDTTTTTILDPVRVRSAALLAVREADLPSLTTSTFAELIPLACEAAREDDLRELVDEIEGQDRDEATLERLLAGLEVGAEEYCPADLDDNPDLFDDLYAALGVLRSTSTTVLATTSSSSTSTTVADSTTTTARATSTTRRTTTTTAPPASTTTTTAPTSTTTTEPPASTTSTSVQEL